MHAALKEKERHLLCSGSLTEEALGWAWTGFLLGASSFGRQPLGTRGQNICCSWALDGGGALCDVNGVLGRLAAGGHLL